MMTGDISVGDCVDWFYPWLPTWSTEDSTIQDLMQKGWDLPSRNQARLMGALWELGVGNFSLNQSNSLVFYWTDDQDEKTMFDPDYSSSNAWYFTLGNLRDPERRQAKIDSTTTGKHPGRMRWVRPLA